MSFSIALKAFFAALGNNDKAAQIERVLSGERAIEAAKPAAETKPAAQPKPVSPARDSALTLLAALQREARLVDLIHEDLNQYSDAQVGAAARPCLQQCVAVLDRMLGLKPLVDAADGNLIEVGESASPTRYQWTGEGSAASDTSATAGKPVQGKLLHHGWQATKTELPTWSGDAADAKIIAPAQVQAP